MLGRVSRFWAVVWTVFAMRMASQSYKWDSKLSRLYSDRASLFFCHRTDAKQQSSAPKGVMYAIIPSTSHFAVSSSRFHSLLQFELCHFNATLLTSPFVFSDRFYYTFCDAPVSDDEENARGERWFSLEKRLDYKPFFLDFGPLNLGHLYIFCTAANNLLAAVRY